MPLDKSLPNSGSYLEPLRGSQAESRKHYLDNFMVLNSKCCLAFSACYSELQFSMTISSSKNLT